MSKHSPGPWTDHFGDIYSGDRCVTRKDWRYSDDDPQWQADARLIVAAPRMLELLRDLLALAEWFGCEVQPPIDPGPIRALIADIDGTKETT